MKHLMLHTSVIALLMGGSAFAQDQNQTGEQTRAADTQQMETQGDGSGNQAAGEQASDRQATGQQAADQQANGGQSQGVEVIALNSWGYDDIYAEGLSYERMIDDADVLGPTGEEIGDVENVLIDDTGQAVALIAEVGGFWDIGDTHVSVPWSEIEISVGGDEIMIPVREETVDDYWVGDGAGFFFRDEAQSAQVVDDDLQTGANVWKATDLVGDYAYLTGNDAYGYVNDLIFTSDGKLDAVVVNARGAGAPGYYAYPYTGYGVGWNPGAARYDMPYARDDIAVIETFEYDRMQRGQGVDTQATSASIDGNADAPDMETQDMGTQDMDEGMAGEDSRIEPTNQ